MNKQTNMFGYHMFLLLLASVSIAFAWIAMPYFSAILWAVILALVFRPLFQVFSRRFPKHPTLSALMTLSIVTVAALIPAIFLLVMLVQQSINFYQMIQSGHLDFATYATEFYHVLPTFAQEFIHEKGWDTAVDISSKLNQLGASVSRLLAQQAVTVSSNTFNFVMATGIMLYLLFFFLRDGERMVQSIYRCIPLSIDQKEALFNKFSVVSRATVKGSFVIALVQGVLGGLIFLFLGIPNPLLWGVVMAFLSLLPAVGNALVWFPVGIYLLIVGEYVQGVILLVWGALVMGMVDNFLRPLLVGKSTKLPDYLVLLSTLGGLSVWGINGLVLGPVIAALFLVAWQLLADQIQAKF